MAFCYYGYEVNKVEEKKLPQRKRNRWKNYDYDSKGAYFVTICTKDKKIFCGIVLLICNITIVL